ncbi:MAG: hypothetical protein M0036_17935 [Desulfobacteraceae bacterium]|nr:hypothetical protein [Desulfobacteraceae bacterium]
MTNTGFDQMLKFYLSAESRKKYDNIYRLLFAQDGFRPYVKEWPAMEQLLIARLWEEMVATQNAELIDLYQEILQLRTSEAPVDFQIDLHLPMLTFTLEKGAVSARFFSTITTLGTPLDLTTQELRIESLFPADEETKQLFPMIAAV